MGATSESSDTSRDGRTPRFQKLPAWRQDEAIKQGETSCEAPEAKTCAGPQNGRNSPAKAARTSQDPFDSARLEQPEGETSSTVWRLPPCRSRPQIGRCLRRASRTVG